MSSCQAKVVFRLAGARAHRRDAAGRRQRDGAGDGGRRGGVRLHRRGGAAVRPQVSSGADPLLNSCPQPLPGRPEGPQLAYRAIACRWPLGSLVWLRYAYGTPSLDRAEEGASPL